MQACVTRPTSQVGSAVRLWPVTVYNFVVAYHIVIMIDCCVTCRLQVQYEKAQNEVNETYDFYLNALEERRQEILRELESTYKTKQVPVNL